MDLEVNNFRVMVDIVVRLNVFELIPGALGTAAEQIHRDDRERGQRLLQHLYACVRQLRRHTG